MFILKACPKCHGDLVAESSPRRLDPEVDVSCLQCGYYLAPAQRSALQRLFSRQTRLRHAPAPVYARR